jgi:hypothetical protein
MRKNKIESIESKASTSKRGVQSNLKIQEKRIKESNKKPSKRFKRNEVIAKQEKLKMLRKYKKMMRKEKASGNSGETNKNLTSTESIYDDEEFRTNKTKQSENNKKAKLSGNFKDKQFLTANKKAQIEYEKKKKEKEEKLQVLLILLELC